MRCRFCNQDKPRLARAHIIPRSFFRLVRGEGHYSVLMRASRKAVTQDYTQAGIYDCGILCVECERRFSRYDTHGFAVFTNVFLHKTLYLDTYGIPCALLLPNVNFLLLKLFVLSVLWRASVSRLDFFNNVDLGPHEEIIKSLISNDTVEGGDHYEFVCFHHIGQPYPGVILPPWKRRISAVNYVQLYLPNIQILVKVDRRPFPRPFPTIAIRPSPPHYLAFLPFEGSTESNFFEGMKRAIRDHQWVANGRARRRA
jgi:hypothetical protein